MDEIVKVCPYNVECCHDLCMAWYQETVTEGYCKLIPKDPEYSKRETTMMGEKQSPGDSMAEPTTQEKWIVLKAQEAGILSAIEMHIKRSEDLAVQLDEVRGLLAGLLPEVVKG